MDQQRIIAGNIIESLRKGVPPVRGVADYSVGNEKLMKDIKTFHLNEIANCGKIRFVSGSWGSGKTHFFRQLREMAFRENCLVSNVELGKDSAALNKFQSVFAAIIKSIVTPSSHENQTQAESAPFGTLLDESLAWLTTNSRIIPTEIPYEQYARTKELLMANRSIDIDFKKMVQKYWETFLAEDPDPSVIEQTRGEILQWFSGEGTVGAFRKRFGVSKLLSKDNAKFMLQSLAAFVQFSGYKGLVILFDEAEQSYSGMRKAALREAHNNLLSLINNIESHPGLFLVYATTPDFFSSEKHGIVTYGALSGRIGKPDDRPPRALNTIWNLDAIETKLEDYQKAALKIQNIYTTAYPESKSTLPSDTDVTEKVQQLNRLHPSLATVRFWRLLVTAIVANFDDCISGEQRDTEVLYDDIMERLKDD